MKRPDPEQQTIGIILSGGAGQRFDGADKGLIMLRGKRMIEWVIEAVEPQVDKLVISMHRNHPQYAALGYPLVKDLSPEFEGPVAGIVAVVNAETGNDQALYLICSCDSPWLPADYVSKLAGALNSTEADVVVVHDGKRRQHLHCLIRGSVMHSLAKYFNTGGRSMYGWLAQVRTTEVDFSTQAECFSNINSPDELRNL